MCVIKTLDTTPRFFTPAAAVQTAAELTASDEDGWKYIAEHDPAGTGYSLVKVYDQDGEYIATI